MLYLQKWKKSQKKLQRIWHKISKARKWYKENFCKNNCLKLNITIEDLLLWEFNLQVFQERCAIVYAKANVCTKAFRSTQKSNFWLPILLCLIKVSAYSNFIYECILSCMHVENLWKGLDAGCSISGWCHHS